MSLGITIWADRIRSNGRGPFIAFMLAYLNYAPLLANIHKAYAVLMAFVVATGIGNVTIGSNYLYTAYLPASFDLLAWLLGTGPITRIIINNV